MMNETNLVSRNSGVTGFRRRVLFVAGTVVLVVLVLAVLWFAGKVFLLIFGGILLAVFLRGISDWLSKHREAALSESPISRQVKRHRRSCENFSYSLFLTLAKFVILD
jgi:hypothetical protein